MILDVRQSEVTRCTKKGYRVVLPRTIDLVFDLLETLSKMDISPEVLQNLQDQIDNILRKPLDDPDNIDSLEVLVLDFIDAFWQVPATPQERRHFVGKMKKRFFIYRRTAQGSRNGPLNWSVMASQATRLAQSLFVGPFPKSSSSKQNQSCRFAVKINTYVDDPAVIVHGDKATRDKLLVKLVVIWMVMGFLLAFHKAQRGKQIQWIGFEFKIFLDRIQVTIPSEKIEELVILIMDFRKSNVISVDELRSFAGKRSSIGSAIMAWKPFTNEIWGALNAVGSPRAGNPPPGCVWRSQVDHSLKWMLAFLQPGRNPDLVPGTGLVRSWGLHAYQQSGAETVITVDAFPFGVGATLEINNKFVEYIMDPLTESDVKRFKHELGSSTGQQTWEALILLIALRQWKSHWRHVRCRLHLRGDNVSALIMVMSMKVKGFGPASIAREIALDLADAIFAPQIASHVPGIANEVCDVLSRKQDPSKAASWKLPGVLAEAIHVQVPCRNSDYYFTM